MEDTCFYILNENNLYYINILLILLYKIDIINKLLYVYYINIY